MDTATKHMVHLLRSLADELEAGNGVALDIKCDSPRGAGYGGELTYSRTYALSLVIEQRKPEVNPA